MEPPHPEAVGRKHAGIVVYLRHLGQVEERATRKVSDFIGTLNEKVEIIFTPTKISSIDGAYGPTYFIHGHDADGNRVTVKPRAPGRPGVGPTTMWEPPPESWRP